jgi:hypothetical protein
MGLSKRKKHAIVKISAILPNPSRLINKRAINRYSQ